MAMILNWFSVSLFLILHCLSANGEVADGESSWTLNFARSTNPDTCTKEARTAADLCFNKVAKTEKERQGCARIFVNSYPHCFFSPEEEANLESAECNKYCWKHYGKCMFFSKPGGEQFTCRNFRVRCIKVCGKKASKRSMLAMLNQELERFMKRRELNGQKSQSKDIAALYRLVSMIKARRENIGNSASTGETMSNAANRELSQLASRSEATRQIDVAVKRSDPVECQRKCLGHYEACLTIVGNVAEHVICLEAKQQCGTVC